MIIKGTVEDAAIYAGGIEAVIIRIEIGYNPRANTTGHLCGCLRVGHERDE
jgi:hypothetical protein